MIKDIFLITSSVSVEENNDILSKKFFEKFSYTFSIGLLSEIKNIGEHPEDKKPVRVMKGQYGPYIKYKSLNATIPEEKDPTELTMEEALILIEKRKEYDKTKKSKKRKSK